MKKNLFRIITILLVLMLVFSCSNDQKIPEPAEPEVRIPTTEEIKPTPEAGSDKAVELTTFMDNAQADLIGYAMGGKDLPIIIKDLVTQLNGRTTDFDMSFDGDISGFTATLKNTSNLLGYGFNLLIELKADVLSATIEIKEGETTYKLVDTIKFGDGEGESKKNTSQYYKNGVEVTDADVKTEISNKIDKVVENVGNHILTLINKGPITLLDGKLKINLKINPQLEIMQGKVILSNLTIGKNTYSLVAEINIFSENIGINASGNTSGEIGDHTVALQVKFSTKDGLQKLTFYIDDYIMIEMGEPETDPPTTT